MMNARIYLHEEQGLLMALLVSIGTQKKERHMKERKDSSSSNNNNKWRAKQSSYRP
jgi:hypothetical protein